MEIDTRFWSARNMLRRLSDVTIGSLEKILNLGGGGGGGSENNTGNNTGNCNSSSDLEKKRKFTEEAVIQSGSRLRKCKGQWDLSSFDDDNANDSSDDELLSLDSSDFPSDLSINEEEWTDYLTFQQQEQEEFAGDTMILDLPKNSVDLVYWNEFYKSLRMRARRGIDFKRSEVLKGHADLSFVMRAKLINWIFEVSVHYKLQRETVYCTQMLIDSFLTLSVDRALPRTRLQLLGLACLLISAKLEEIRPPNLHDLVQISDDLYSEQEIAKMELEVCSRMKWNLTPVNALTWLRFYTNNLQMFDSSDPIVSIEAVEGKLDLLMHLSAFLDFKPSHISAALLFHSVSNDDARDKVSKCTGFKIVNLQSELDWIDTVFKCKPPTGQVAYAGDRNLSDSEFDAIIEGNKRVLKFILQQIKLEGVCKE